MNARQWDALSQNLAWVPLVGGWLGWQAVRALAAERTPDAARRLAEVVARGGTGPAPAFALGVLERLARDLPPEVTRSPAQQQTVHAVCSAWAATRHPRLAKLVAAHGWLAQEPPALRVLTALLLGRTDRVSSGGAEVVDPLLSAAHDGDPAVAGRARDALRALAHPDAREALCRVVIERDDHLARESALVGGYVPRSDVQRALYFFMAGQWERYEALDFDRSLLRAAYEQADEWLRPRIMAVARQAGRVEWVSVVAGGSRARRVAAMTAEEWETTRAVLAEGKRWPELWRLVPQGPPGWSARALRDLDRAGWRPSRPDDRAGFAELLRLSAPWAESPPALGELVSCRELEGHAGRVICLALSPDGTLLATGGGDNLVRLWSLPEGRLLHTLHGHRYVVGHVAFSPDGKKLISREGERGLRAGERVRREWAVPEGRLLAATAVPHPDPQAVLAVATEGADPAEVLHGEGAPEEDPLPEVVRAAHQGRIVQRVRGAEARVLVTRSADRVCVWLMPEARLLKALAWRRGEDPDRVQQVALSPDGQVLATRADDHTLTLRGGWDWEPFKTISPAHQVECLAFTPDGRTLVTGGRDRRVRLWDLGLLSASRLAVAAARPEQLARVEEALRAADLPGPLRPWLEWVHALARFRGRYDIALAEGPSRIAVGGFDIEIEGLPP
jgi:hypothetical protein